MSELYTSGLSSSTPSLNRVFLHRLLLTAMDPSASLLNTSQYKADVHTSQEPSPNRQRLPAAAMTEHPARQSSLSPQPYTRSIQPSTSTSRPVEQVSMMPDHENEPRHSPVATKQPEQQVFLVPECSDDQSDSPGSRRGLLAFLTAFWFELLSLVIGICALIAITITLPKFNGKEQPAWKYSVNLNTLIAILSTLLRVCVLYGVEEGTIPISMEADEADH